MNSRMFLLGACIMRQKFSWRSIILFVSVIEKWIQFQWFAVWGANTRTPLARPLVTCVVRVTLSAFGHVWRDRTRHAQTRENIRMLADRACVITAPTHRQHALEGALSGRRSTSCVQHLRFFIHFLFFVHVANSDACEPEHYWCPAGTCQAS